LNDLEGHSPLADVFTCNPSNFVWHFTRYQLTVCSHGSSELAEALVSYAMHRVGLRSVSSLAITLVPLTK